MSDVRQGPLQCYIVANKYVEAIFPISRIIVVFLCKRVRLSMFTFPYNETKQYWHQTDSAKQTTKTKKSWTELQLVDCAQNTSKESLAVSLVTLLLLPL